MNACSICQGAEPRKEAPFWGWCDVCMMNFRRCALLGNAVGAAEWAAVRARHFAARAARRASVLEAFSALDNETRGTLFDELAALHRKAGTASRKAEGRR